MVQCDRIGYEGEGSEHEYVRKEGVGRERKGTCTYEDSDGSQGKRMTVYMYMYSHVATCMRGQD